MTIVDILQSNMMIVAIVGAVLIFASVIIYLFSTNKLDDIANDAARGATRWIVKWSIILLTALLILGSLFSLVAEGFSIEGINPFYVINELVEIIKGFI